MTAIGSLPKGVVYKGVVDYVSDLPSAPEAGDTYTVKYKGDSGAEVWHQEFVWGSYEGVMSWIPFGADYTADISRIDQILSASVGYEEIV